MGERVAIVGSRTWRDAEMVRDYVAGLAADAVVVSGGATGVDLLAEYYARKRRLSVSIHHAWWNVYGNRAGYIRNEKIVADCDRVVAFWDGESRGTKHTIDIATKAGKPVEIIRPREARTKTEGGGNDG